MFRAFWDSLQEKLDQDPPDFGHALTLLQEVKEVSGKTRVLQNFEFL